MIQRFIGVSIGAAVTFGLLWFNSADANAWATAAILGAIASFFWPIVAGFFLGRRAKQRRDQSIQDEVARQVAAQTNKPPV
jgi:uncharacterized protein YgiB involved in biofilm formation